jgi:TonB family protein
MPQPEAYGTTPSWDRKSSDKKSLDTQSADKKSSGVAGEAFSAREVTDVFRTLAAHGGAASFDLALDLVMNEVVQEARLETGATGAAIALSRDGEMVCRATTGANAPELGVRFEMTSGLSGACLQTGIIQQCTDTETDARVNAEDCRRLGVRSMMVLPLGDAKDPFGILEVFSSSPNAFSDRDVNTLRVMAHRVAENKRIADEVAALVPSTDDKSHAHANGTKTSIEYEPLGKFDSESLAEEGSARRSEVWTSVLAVLVIVAALSLGLAIGWRVATGKGLKAGSQMRSSTSSTARADRRTDSGAEARNGSASQPKTANPVHPSSVEASSGGLVVTQNGKVIYRLPPAEQQADAGKGAAPESSEDLSASRLIHRVEPQYPAEATARHIQGLVTLEVQIGGDGDVRNITVVEGDPVLADAALQAVRQWRYRPYSVDGRPVEMQTRITIRFTLPPS